MKNSYIFGAFLIAAIALGYFVLCRNNIRIYSDFARVSEFSGYAPYSQVLVADWQNFTTKRLLGFCPLSPL
jgi:hypothetical protein